MQQGAKAFQGTRSPDAAKKSPMQAASGVYDSLTPEVARREARNSLH
jgi:hypothetical protein